VQPTPFPSPTYKNVRDKNGLGALESDKSDKRKRKSFVLFRSLAWLVIEPLSRPPPEYLYSPPASGNTGERVAHVYRRY